MANERMSARSVWSLAAWWWWCAAVLTVGLAAACTARQDPSLAAAPRGSGPDLFEYLEGVGTTLDLNDRRGRNLYSVLHVARRSADSLAEADAEEGQRRPATSFFTANQFSLEMPPYIRPLRPHRRSCRRRHSIKHVKPARAGRPALPQHTRGQEEAPHEARTAEGASGVQGAGPGGGERLQDAVQGMSRWHEPERLEVIQWHEQERRPRVSQDRVVSKGAAYWYVGVLVVCCCVACCCSCLLVVRQHAEPYFADNIGTCKWLLDEFLHFRKDVLEIQRCLWKFEMVEAVRHDALLVYVTQELRDLHRIYKRDVLDKINALRQPDDRQYLEDELRKKRRQKRKAAFWGKILGV